MLVPEIPFSILPPFFKRFTTADVAEEWRGRPTPTWRGVPCRFGRVAVRLPNEAVTRIPMTFNVFVIVPDRDPPGPPLQTVLLGTEFLRHYGFRILISYDAIDYYTDETTGRREVDQTLPCGYLEKG